jgi:osmotically-inducible protein OsmY
MLRAAVTRSRQVKKKRAFRFSSGRVETISMFRLRANRTSLLSSWEAGGEWSAVNPSQEDIMRTLRSIPFIDFKMPIRALLGLLIVSILAGLWLSPVQAREITDKAITPAVSRELVTHEAVPAHLIDVETTEGVVTLSGSVDNLIAKEQATQVAETVKGVRLVLNQIEVKPIERRDQEILEDVSKALAGDPATDLYEVTPKVEEGVLTLTGRVDSWQEKILCGEVAKGVAGVEELHNEIEAVQGEDRKDIEIEADIRNRLKWDAWVDDALIRVDVKNGNVALSGKVGGAAERRRAHFDAWVAGVKSVEDANLEVDWTLRDEMQRRGPKPEHEIEKALRNAFHYEPRVSGAEIEAILDYGVVTLTGTVDSLAARRAAADAAKATVGVWRVKNHLRVRGLSASPGMMRPELDTDLAEKVQAALLRDPYVRQKDITVTVGQRMAILSGTVHSVAEKLRAEAVASHVKNVVAVQNNISVGRSWEEKEDWEIKEDIEDELWWSTYVDNDLIMKSP